MNAVTSKTFRSGNSIAVRLPKDIAFPVDTSVTVERHGDTLTIRPAIDPAAERAKLARMVERLRILGRPSDGIQARPEIEMPERPGL